MLRSRRYSVQLGRSVFTQKDICEKKLGMHQFKFKDGKKIRQESQVRWSKLTSKSNIYKQQ